MVRTQAVPVKGRVKKNGPADCDINTADVKASELQHPGMGGSGSDGSRLSAREILARNLRALRAQRGWSQEELAFESGLHRTFVAHVERGARNISLDNIEKLANALSVPAHRLLLP